MATTGKARTRKAPPKTRRKTSRKKRAVPDDPVQCSWIWNGVDWVPDPNKPHACPEGQECLKPTQRGVLDDPPVTTPCTSD